MKRKFILLTLFLSFVFVGGYGQNTLNENFDASNTLPSNWSFILDGQQATENELGVEIWIDDFDEGYHSGKALSLNNSAWIFFQECADENAKIWLITPKLRVTSDTSSFVFNMYVDNHLTNMGTFNVYVSTGGNAKEDFNTTSVLSMETAEMLSGFEEYEIDLSAYQGQEIYIALVFADPDAYTYFFIDDVTGPELVEEDDGCTKLSSLPFSENFNNWEWATIAECWKWIGYDFYQGMYYPCTLVNSDVDGTNWLAFLGVEGTENMVVSLPKLADNININALKLNMDVTSLYEGGKLVVGVMTNAEDINTFIAVDTIAPATTHTWDSVEVNFSQYTGTGRYISLRAGNPYSTGQVFMGVDNLILDYALNNNAVYDTVTESICRGDTYSFAGEDRTEAGVYFDTLSQVGDSLQIQVLILTVNPTYSITIDTTINEGQTYTENGFNENQAGIYTLTLQTINGCDSTVTLNLNVESVPCVDRDTVIQASICEGENFAFNDTSYAQAGTYYTHLQTWNGCDSTITLNLSVNPSYSLTIDTTINEGQTYTENGFNENQAGTYTLTLQTINGCDSTITLNLNINSSLAEVANNLVFEIYPNPAKEKLYVNLHNADNRKVVTITNINGVPVYQNTGIKENLVEINLKDFESGVYFVRIDNEIKKLIIEK